MFKILITGRNFGAVSKDDYNYFLDRGYEILPIPVLAVFLLRTNCAK